LQTAAAPIGIDGIQNSVVNSQASQASQSSVVAPISAKSGVAGGARTSAQATLRTAHGTGTADAVQHGTQTVAVQPTSSGAETSSLTRDLASTNGGANTVGGAAAGSTSASAGPTPRETFAALDADPASGTPTWIHAGAQRAEAGYLDPNLGWVGVRADATGGAVHASVVPGSADAAQALGGHLAGLNDYVTQQHLPVDTVTLAAPESRSTDSGMNQGGNQGMNQGAGQNTGQGTYAEPQSNTQFNAPAISGAAPFNGSASANVPDTTAQTARPGGTHISVMA